MFNFAELPPETNSTRMYLGAGSAPIWAAAAAWTVLAKELGVAARGLESVLAKLLESYRGESSEALTGRIMPYVRWLDLTAASAEETATQLEEAAGAYDTARAATVHPLAVYANRAQVMALKVTNLFGQFSTLIAAKELEYDAMWEQDVKAMVAYQAAVLEATAATRSTAAFTPAPEMVNEVGLVEESFGSFVNDGVEEFDELMGVGTSKLGTSKVGTSRVGTSPLGSRVATNKVALGLSSTAAKPLWGGVAQHLGPMSNVVSMVNNKVGMANTGLSMVNGMGSMMKSVVPTAAAKAAEVVAEGGQALGNAFGSMGRGALGSGLGSQLTGGLGKGASLVGSLRVPEAWSAANKAVTPAMHALSPLTSNMATAVESGSAPLMGGVPMAPMASGMGGMGGMGGTVNTVFKTPTRSFIMPRPWAGG
ncbi:PPE family protein [Mycobacterium haemophilum]|uniref:PPE family domain-containing protein n=1 Tax=Mycobacterium haemophilum TaxID=29311 RepID=A0A0I9UA69_9MYCO|nr:PPE family protein [Mycobacterium haemophilum]KLO30707.1 hypothetical protein ABH39_10040 [Mycobacterium haemophilum]KLO37750.1 hypothetical protein ABH38_07250 [Mycobacterium haemophilum]KLO43170.1 hypothetical protein ABH37_07835 [Mycobacterium haemophilum]KLO55572.1 hypothetical protein ABH36_06205 [Mycobacterium haemophilum]